MPAEIYGLAKPEDIARLIYDGSGNLLGVGLQDGQRVQIPYVFNQTAVPVGIAPTFTGSTNGAIVFGTALLSTYTNGIWMYFSADSLSASHPAGFYWCVMSSTTSGIAYNVTPVAKVVPYIPSSTTLFSGAVPGAAGAPVTAVWTLPDLPGGALGNNGSISSHFKSSMNTSANNKIAAIYNGSTPLALHSTVTLIVFENIFTSCNRGSQNKQLNSRLSIGIGSSTTVNGDFPSNTDRSVATTLDMRLTAVGATDFTIIEAFNMTIRPGA